MGVEQASPQPLAALASVLWRPRPPRITALAMWLADMEAFQEFKWLVAEFLPGEQEAILGAGGPQEMVTAFAEAFGQRHFPMDDEGLESFGDLVHHIPIVVNGWEYDDYHELPNMRKGILLGALLVDFEGELGLEREGIRLTALEAAESAKGGVPRELLEPVAGQSFPLASLEVLTGSSHQGLLDLARVLCHETGTVFLDATREEIWSNPPEWCREAVEYLTGEWELAEGIWARVEEFCDWLEEDPERHFAEVMAFLTGKPLRPRAQLVLPGLEDFVTGAWDDTG